MPAPVAEASNLYWESQINQSQGKKMMWFEEKEEENKKLLKLIRSFQSFLFSKVVYIR